MTLPVVLISLLVLFLTDSGNISVSAHRRSPNVSSWNNSRWIKKTFTINRQPRVARTSSSSSSKFSDTGVTSLLLSVMDSIPLSVFHSCTLSWSDKSKSSVEVIRRRRQVNVTVVVTVSAAAAVRTRGAKPTGKRVWKDGTYVLHAATSNRDVRLCYQTRTRSIRVGLSVLSAVIQPAFLPNERPAAWKSQCRSQEGVQGAMSPPPHSAYNVN